MIKFRRATGSQGRLLAGRRAQVLAAGMALLLTSGFTAQANAATKPAHNHFIAYTPEAPHPRAIPFADGCGAPVKTAWLQFVSLYSIVLQCSLFSCSRYSVLHRYSVVCLYSVLLAIQLYASASLRWRLLPATGPLLASMLRV